jgi:hypothetical protein
VNCKKCLGKGYLETSHFSDGEVFESLQQCPDCKDITAYSREVKRRYGTPEELNQNEAKVIELPRGKILKFPTRDQS